MTGTWILRGMLVCAMVALTAASACGSVRSAWRPARPGPAVTPGRTVTPAKTPAPGGSAAALAFPSPLAGWAAVTVPPGADGVPPATAELLATTDGGRSWRAQWTPGGWQPRSVWAERSAIAMSWPSPTVGYASFDGTVARTSDSGQHWTRAWPA